MTVIIRDNMTETKIGVQPTTQLPRSLESKITSIVRETCAGTCIVAEPILAHSLYVSRENLLNAAQI